jgi:hypothetical protein
LRKEGKNMFGLPIKQNICKFSASLDAGTVFMLNCLPYKPTGPVSSNIYRPTINSTGPNLKTTLMTINSNHKGCEEEVDSDDIKYTEDPIDNMILEFSGD